MANGAEVATARAALERVTFGDAAARGAELVPLPGGTGRRSWLVTFASGRKAVLKLPQARSNALLDVATEARAVNAAADAGIAPGVISADAASGILLMQFGDGRRWTDEAAHDVHNIERLAELLRTLHALPTELPEFAAERIATRYLGALPVTVHEPQAADWGKELLALARRYDETYAPTAFCHNDLVAANVLDDGKLALVDFEYACRAAPLLDLANFAAMNGFDARQQREVLTAYRRSPPRAAEIAELEALVRMVRLMAWFWALLGDANSGSSSRYEPYLAALAARLRRA